MRIKKFFLVFILLTNIICSYAQTPSSCGDSKPNLTMQKSNLAIVIYSNDAETVWNAFRLASFALAQKDTVKIFLLGKGVDAENLSSEKFDVKKSMETFVASGGEILACGTCLKIRNKEGTALCPLSTMADLYAIIKQSEKVVTF